MRYIKLYHHKTDGGAEYLMDTFLKWEHNGKEGKEGVLNSKTEYIVRLDGQPELTVKDIDKTMDNKTLYEVLKLVKQYEAEAHDLKIDSDELYEAICSDIINLIK